MTLSSTARLRLYTVTTVGGKEHVLDDMEGWRCDGVLDKLVVISNLNQNVTASAAQNGIIDQD